MGKFYEIKHVLDCCEIAEEYYCELYQQKIGNIRQKRVCFGLFPLPKSKRYHAIGLAHFELILRLDQIAKIIESTYLETYEVYLNQEQINLIGAD